MDRIVSDSGGAGLISVCGYLDLKALRALKGTWRHVGLSFKRDACWAGGQWGQWAMGPPETLTLHKHGQIILNLAETPPYSSARFTFILNILVPSSQNYENHEILDF